jgi:hypothetical protein
VKIVAATKESAAAFGARTVRVRHPARDAYRRNQDREGPIAFSRYQAIARSMAARTGVGR